MISYRLDIAGSWGSHPFMNAVYPQIQIIARIEGDFKNGAGLSGSSRKTIIENPELTPQELWAKENEGKQFVVGVEDICGILDPGLKIYYYRDDYWMNETEYLPQKSVDWLNTVLHLVYTHDRPKNLNVLGELRLTREKVRDYRISTYSVLSAIESHDLKTLAETVTENHNILMSIMPRREIEMNYEWGLGRKLCGAGGGGYVLVVDDKPVEGEEKFKII